MAVIDWIVVVFFFLWGSDWLFFNTTRRMHRHPIQRGIGVLVSVGVIAAVLGTRL